MEINDRHISLSSTYPVGNSDDMSMPRYIGKKITGTLLIGDTSYNINLSNTERDQLEFVVNSLANMRMREANRIVKGSVTSTRNGPYLSFHALYANLQRPPDAQ
ncbi:MAG: hypothetical protein V4489_08370 [Chlamydiota bacterium]